MLALKPRTDTAAQSAAVAVTIAMTAERATRTVSYWKAPRIRMLAMPM